jgi:co-chaperonin GroES (HSP10)
MVVIVHHFCYYQNMDKTEPVIGLYPLNDCVLVELKQSHKNFTTKEGKYQTRTEGIVVAIPLATDMADSKEDIAAFEKYNTQLAIAKKLVGKRVHFEEFKEGARIKRDGKIYSFIKLEDIRGWEEA